MRARSALVLALLLGTLVGCAKRNSATNPNGPSGSGTTPSGLGDDPNANVGPRLYDPAPDAVFPPQPPAGSEPIVIANCYIQYEDRQQVSAEVNGTIDLIASPMTFRNGRYEWVQHDGTVVGYDPARPHPSIVFHPRDAELFPDDRLLWVPYWKLQESDVVAKGQILCLLDDQLVTTKMRSAEKSRAAAIEVQRYAKEGVGNVEAKIALYKGKIAESAIPPSQRLDDLITLSRFLENLAQANAAIAKADQEYSESELMIRKHQITSRVAGIIRSVPKRAGEYVQAGEKILEIQSTEKVRLEGNLDIQYARRVKRGMLAAVEPAIPSAPVASHDGHRQEVGGVAVTGHANRPLIVSASLDGRALVWDPNLGNAKDRSGIAHGLPHPVPVRCVACTPPGDGPILAITGADDGKVRFWDLTDPARLPTEPKHQPADFHTSGVTAIAVSPNGKFAATAAGREVFVWDLTAGKRLYSLPPEHRDTVTALSFTPQGQLVTAAKDRTLKVWKLGSEKAAVARTVDHRSGVVDALGVSPDGGRMLFDQDKGRIDLVNLSDAQTVGQLANVGPNVAFATLALFGPEFSADDKHYTVVTAGGEGDLKGGLQVWQAPRAGGRGAEIARLITPGRATVTCAAFSPHKDARFLVVGTATGQIHVWTPPSEPAKKLEGRITIVDSTDPRYVTVRAEMLNIKDAPILDKGTATLIVNPWQ